MNGAGGGRYALLEKIRDQYCDIRLLSMHCCSDISPDALPDMIRERTDLLETIALEERRIAESFGDEPMSSEETLLRGEIRQIMESIVMLDRQVQEVIREHMSRIRSDLSSLYRTSRAASAYALQSARH